MACCVEHHATLGLIDQPPGAIDHVHIDRDGVDPGPHEELGVPGMD